MTPDLSAVVVSHRTASEAIACVASLRRAFASGGVAGEVVLVDCGSGPDEARRLARAGADVLVALAENRGYAGGLNAGLARARSARLLLSNADVVFGEGAIPPLLDAIADPRVGAAAPLAFWDASERLRLPPGWAPSFARDLAQLAAGRSPARDERRFAAFARETLRLWSAGGDATHLSGAVLAARRDVFDRAGRFDERFPFEFEETEWEDRVRRLGLALRFVARARVRHVWGASATVAGDVTTRRERSRREYRRRRYGALGATLLERAARRSATPAFAAVSEPRLTARPGAWAAVSANPSLLPFAGAPLDEDFELPDEIVRRAPARLYLRAFRASDGAPLETFAWTPGGGGTARSPGEP